MPGMTAQKGLAAGDVRSSRRKRTSIVCRCIRGSRAAAARTFDSIRKSRRNHRRRSHARCQASGHRPHKPNSLGPWSAKWPHQSGSAIFIYGRDRCDRRLRSTVPCSTGARYARLQQRVPGSKSFAQSMAQPAAAEMLTSSADRRSGAARVRRGGAYRVAPTTAVRASAMPPAVAGRRSLARYREGVRMSLAKNTAEELSAPALRRRPSSRLSPGRSSAAGSPGSGCASSSPANPEHWADVRPGSSMGSPARMFACALCQGRQLPYHRAP